MILYRCQCVEANLEKVFELKHELLIMEVWASMKKL
jgi:hypothetical protein